MSEKLIDAAIEWAFLHWRLLAAFVVWFTPGVLLSAAAPSGVSEVFCLLTGTSILPFAALVRWIDKTYPKWSVLKVEQQPAEENEPYVVHIGTSVGFRDLVGTGDPVLLALKGKAGLLATGVPGSGKTVFVQYLLAMLRLRGAELTILDMKAGGDFRAFAAAGVPVFSGDIVKAVEVLEGAVKKMETRLQEFASVDLNKPNNYWNMPLNERPPLLVYAVDEVQELLETDGASKEEKLLMERASAALRRLVKLGRSAGVFTVVATQKSDGKAIPTSFRDQIDLRVSGRQRTREASRAALGELQEDFPQPHDEEAIPVGVPGRLVIDGISTNPITFQGFYLDEMQLASVLGVNT